MKKILMIGPFPNPITGQSIANEMLLEGLKDEGYIVDFIDTNTEKKIEALSKQGKFSWKKIINSMKPISKGVFKIFFLNYDIIYITPAQTYMGFLKYIPFINVAFFKKIPCYIHIHGGYIRKMFDSCSLRKQIYIKKIFKKCTGVIVLGESLKYMFDDLIPKEKLYICNNSVGKEYVLQSIELEEKLKKIRCESKIRILYLSNLMKSKGIIETLEMCKVLKDNKLEFHIDVAGDIEENIIDEVKEYFNYLEDNLTYHGVVSGKKKRILFKNANIFCLPINYKYEGQPIAILEAMGMGCAVITTNNGGIKDIFINRKHGVVFDSDNILNDIQYLKTNLVSFSKNNHFYIKEKFQFDNYIESIINIISQSGGNNEYRFCDKFKSTI